MKTYNPYWFRSGSRRLHASFVTIESETKGMYRVDNVWDQVECLLIYNVCGEIYEEQQLNAYSAVTDVDP